MDRMEEYKSLTEELKNTPPALEYTVQRARARVSKRRVRRLFELPAVSIAGVFAAFVLLVNLSTPFALACGNVPILKELTAAVSFFPSLKAAVENDYVQIMDLTQTQNGVTMTIDYVIVDNKQVNIFYTTESSRFPRFSAIPSIRTSEDGVLEGYSISSGAPGENDSLRKFVIDFVDGDVPQCLKLMCGLIPLQEEFSEEPVRDDGKDHTDWAQPEALVTFTFDLRFDPAYTGAGEIVAINRWLILDSQRILVKNVEIYPTHVRLNLGDDEKNTAWLQSLDFYLQDERGNRYEKIGNGITATGSADSRFMAGHRLESSYFGDTGHLTVFITGATWLDKDMEYVDVDLTAGTAGAMPGWLCLEEVERLGSDRFRLTLSAPCRGEGGFFELMRWDYLDETGKEGSFDSKSVTGMDGDPERFAERFVLEDYPYNTVRLGLSSTRMVELDTPIEITVK